jgi:myo-inositol-1(or 4)-monophosphatase
MQSEYLKVMIRFVREGAVIALKNIHKSSPGIKADKTIVTKTDHAVSRLAHKILAPVLKDPDHILIDEEDPTVIQYLDQKRLGEAKYIWSVDPIDGTRLYANGIPTFGISIGLIKDLKPWLGVVYFPMLNELFYCDGKNSWHVTGAFTTQEKKKKIVPVDQTISSQTIFFCNDTYFRKYSFNDPQFHVMIQACAVVNLLWPAVGRGCGCFLRSSLWDFAGSWPIFRSAGLELRRLRDGKWMDSLDASLFKGEPKPWELLEHYMLSSKRNYNIIKSKIVEIAA